MTIGIDHIFQELYKHDIRYLLTGGLAVNLYGVNRMTADIDLILDLTKENIKKFHSVIRKINFIPLLPLPFELLADKIERLKIIEEKNLVAYSFYNKTKKFLNIDVIIDIPKSFSELWENRIVKTTDDYQINLIGFDDLILLKEYANRVQDKNDILLLKSANKK
ncbi:MAG: hypothetical protein IPK18_13170 [Sphingobacteriales bacterium]|jgi:hypothetical protein|nr:MAG: hypothetical protein IPK18_13170 [Sphingobacteriales bacterium]